MKLNQRYVKVFALYFVSIVTANIIVKNNNLIKTLIQTIAGYTVFALGLKYLTKRKINDIYTKTAMTLLCHGCFNWEWDSNDIFAKFISSSHHNMH